MIRKAIEIKNLHCVYPDGTRALSDLNLDVYEGEAIGLIGPNGAGKSTLLLHLNGLLKAEGCIRIFDIEVTDKNLHEIRRTVGLVFQHPEHQLFMPTVFDDVAFGPINMGLDKGQVGRAVEVALREVDMLAFAKRSSHHMSLGEQKRAAIATVLSMTPRILVLDEPSSNLDPKHRRELIHFLKQMNLTTIIATHDLGLVSEICTRIVVLDEGRVAVMGHPADILEDRDLLTRHGLA